MVNTLTQFQFEDMFRTQFKVNDVQSSKEWVNGTNQFGLHCDWTRAIRMELIEALDSFQWKFWKSVTDNPQYSVTDIENLKVELVDIWHFMMSQRMTDSGIKDLDQLDKSSLAAYEFNTLTSVLDGADIDEWTSEGIFKLLESSVFSDKLISSRNLFIAICYAFSHSPSSKDDPLGSFYRSYITKATLNLFRAEHGYAEGEYKKQWVFNGQVNEDNVVAYQLSLALQKVGKFNSESLYDHLEDVYKKMG
ncbi:hypothetical protein C3I27_04185 [Campylobacter jejuni]|uniref:dUTPase n=1 Tax=Campylobacter jejuni TaxID=197 RepID=A0A430VC39_CAMJU|nr:dUTP diphosphatase [Campylobacter jejuni]RTI48627.1 hypothetical protein C3I27_04185 [Campylobacter jejuni]RTJ78352.1 hypothetical protein C3H57_08580 [Campylobacter jejuni]HEG8091441.1 dUTP diphosphatase [Campylobacter jejuni]HEG8097879.1 dUTP diphosphatase [Campylobacter jejuni]HEG8104726.1 dUTP diphosphatase [Campylobacter jejuni]